MQRHDVLVLFEHPDWQKPLFTALGKRGLSYSTLDLKKAAFESGTDIGARLVFNQASPSAYVRGNARAVPLALAYLKALEHAAVPVVNGARAFALELSKTAQCSLLRALGLRTPRSIAFNEIDALEARVREDATWRFPALLKPEQGGSGARIEKVGSVDEVRALLAANPKLWEPDGLFLLQEHIEHDTDRGVVRMEFLGGELLYAMRVVSHGRFNLCPSEFCNPIAPNAPNAPNAEAAICEVPQTAAPPVEFYAYPGVPKAAVEAGQRIVRQGGLDVGGIEYLESNGELVFYDINANSNLRPAIAREHGFDAFERVVDYLEHRLARGA